MFSDVKNTDDLLSVAIYVRERVNPYLFQYSYSVALLHRPDTQNVELPSMVHSFPEKFFHSKVMGKARAYGEVVPSDKRVRVLIESIKLQTSIPTFQFLYSHIFIMFFVKKNYFSFNIL